MKGRLLERVANYLYGYVHVKVTGYTARVLTAMLNAGIEYYDLSCDGDLIEFNMPIRFRRALSRVLATQQGCSAVFSPKRGAVSVVRKYRRRPGLVVGAFVFAALLWGSTFFVWDIAVEGNKRFSDAEIIESFEEFGFGYGVFLPSVDLDGLCHSYLLASEDLAWVSVNMEGTKASIVVKERTDPTPVEADTPSDIIAAEDGQITSFAVWSGEGQVHLGQVVKKGDLLIAGTKDRVEEGELVGYDVFRSKGSVQAQVFREYTVKVPLTGTHKIYTGEKKIEKRYKFFTKDTKTFGNSGNNDGFYDKIESSKRVVLFGVINLPIFEEIAEYREYVEQPYEYTEEQGAAFAESEMMKLLSEELYGCELLSKKSTGTCEDGVYTLRCGVYCITDIAKEVEIQSGEKDGRPTIN